MMQKTAGEQLVLFIFTAAAKCGPKHSTTAVDWLLSWLALAPVGEASHEYRDQRSIGAAAAESWFVQVVLQGGMPVIDRSFRG
jgi:hypothetical protein